MKLVENLPTCPVCNGRQWQILSDPCIATRCVSTDGKVFHQKLGRIHCESCGIASRLSSSDSENIEDFYAQEYELHERLAPANYDLRRFRSYVNWINKLWQGTPPAQVLEVGCGNGVFLEALKEIWPKTNVSGIEPSQAAAHSAQARGAKVVAGFLNSTSTQPQYDLILSLHVIEHVTDPVVFLQEQAERLHSGGKVIIICPDGQKPHNDLLFRDHLWSFTKAHLEYFCRQSGLTPLVFAQTLEETNGEVVQFILAEKNYFQSETHNQFEPQPDLFQRREAYLNRWQKLDELLCQRVSNIQNLACFGAGEWTSLLMTYCPNLWSKVQQCWIDGNAGIKDKKPVLTYDPKSFKDFDGVLIGTKPAYHQLISQRLKNDGFTAINWDDLVEN